MARAKSTPKRSIAASVKFTDGTGYMLFDVKGKTNREWQRFSRELAKRDKKQIARPGSKGLVIRRG
jgi:hypothetical protein